jgi:hypothetical protein
MADQQSIVRFEVVTAVTMLLLFFWVVTLQP